MHCVPQNLLLLSGWETVAFLDFQHSFVAEKETSEREWDLTIRSGLKPHRALVGNIERVLLKEVQRLSVT